MMGVLKSTTAACAFIWEEYHEAGEIYFDHLGTPEENEKDTLDKWNCFLEALEEIERKGK